MEIGSRNGSFPQWNLELVETFSGEGKISMETPEQYLKNADECDRLASQIPTHAESLRKIAEA
jgi:hypothetical protein